jgi:hypothetical protein
VIALSSSSLSFSSTYLRVFKYSDLWTCSKDDFSRSLALWGLDGIEKDFVDVFGSISGYSYTRDRDGWSIDGTDQHVLIDTGILSWSS